MKKLLTAAFLLLLPALAGAFPIVSQQGSYVTVRNNTTTGTTLNTLTTFDSSSPSTAIIAPAGTTSGVIGVTVAGAGTTGAALIQTNGQVDCIFDGATTAGDYVSPSSSTSGYCHDAGASSGSTTIGIVNTTNSAGGTYTIFLSTNTSQQAAQPINLLPSQTASYNAQGFGISNLAAPTATGDALSEGNAIGATTPAAGTFTGLSSTGTLNLTGGGTSATISKTNVNSVINVMSPQYGAKCDGTTNDSTAIQNAINAAATLTSTNNAGGIVQIPPGVTCKANVTLPSYVTLQGPISGAMPPQGGGVNSPATIVSADATGATPTISIGTVSTRAYGAAIRGLWVKGNGTGTGDICIKEVNGASLMIEHDTIYHCGQEGVMLSVGAVNFTNTAQFNTINDTLRDYASFTNAEGAVEVGPNSDFNLIYYNNIACANTSKSGATLYTKAIYLDGPGSMVINNDISFCDEGLADNGSSQSGSNRIYGNRIDHNYANGVDLAWGNDVVNNNEVDDSNIVVGDDNTYDAFHVTGGQSLFVGNYVKLDGSPAGKFRYGFFDGKTSASQYNKYDSSNYVQSGVFATAAWNNTATTGSASMPQGSSIEQLGTSATPSVIGNSLYFASDGSPTTVTGITGVGGQCIDIESNNENLTLQNGTGSATAINTAVGANVVLHTRRAKRFCQFGGTGWIEVGSPGFESPVTATYGATVTPDLSEGRLQTITVTDGSAWTLANAINAAAGESWTIDLFNNSGGAMGAITLGANYKADASWGAPANGKRRVCRVTNESTSLFLIGPCSADL